MMGLGYSPLTTFIISLPVTNWSVPKSSLLGLEYYAMRSKYLPTDSMIIANPQPRLNECFITLITFTVS